MNLSQEEKAYLLLAIDAAMDVIMKDIKALCQEIVNEGPSTLKGAKLCFEPLGIIVRLHKDGETIVLARDELEADFKHMENVN